MKTSIKNVNNKLPNKVRGNSDSKKKRKQIKTDKNCL